MEHSPWSAAATGSLPDGVDFEMLDVNLDDCLKSSAVPVRFFPNGTCDEMTLVLHSTGAVAAKFPWNFPPPCPPSAR